jgi:urease accessory protein
VIAEMIEGLGGRCAHVLAPFDPEGGAYEGGGHGHHHHDDEQDHRHHHEHAHG